jgi:uncharacterized protein YdhG (YjbR/CyaY superfamily)
MARTASGGQDGDGLSDLERDAVKQRAAELKTEARRGRGRATAGDKAAAEAAEVVAKIAGMPESDRAMAERLHAIVAEVAPDLTPKLYYGQPGYARKGKVVCFFRSGQQDKERYSTLGFSAQAQLDDGAGLWPSAYALIDPTEEAWATVADLVRRAAG